MAISKWPSIWASLQLTPKSWVGSISRCSTPTLIIRSNPQIFSLEDWCMVHALSNLPFGAMSTKRPITCSARCQLARTRNGSTRPNKRSVPLIFLAESSESLPNSARKCSSKQERKPSKDWSPKTSLTTSASYQANGTATSNSTNFHTNQSHKALSLKNASSWSTSCPQIPSSVRMWSSRCGRTTNPQTARSNVSRTSSATIENYEKSSIKNDIDIFLPHLFLTD